MSVGDHSRTYQNGPFFSPPFFPGHRLIIVSSGIVSAAWTRFDHHLVFATQWSHITAIMCSQWKLFSAAKGQERQMSPLYDHGRHSRLQQCIWALVHFPFQKSPFSVGLPPLGARQLRPTSFPCVDCGGHYATCCGAVLVCLKCEWHLGHRHQR